MTVEVCMHSCTTVSQRKLIENCDGLKLLTKANITIRCTGCTTDCISCADRDIFTKYCTHIRQGPAYAPAKLHQFISTGTYSKLRLFKAFHCARVYKMLCHGAQLPVFSEPMAV